MGSAYCAPLPPGILVLQDSWANVLWGSDFGAREEKRVRPTGCALGPCVRSLLRVQPKPGNPQRGCWDLRALAPPARKMAAPGFREKARERSQVWDPARVPQAPARLESREGKLDPAWVRSCLNSSLRRSAMAASETPPGISCFHALKRLPVPTARVGLLGGPGWEMVEKKKGWSLQSPGREGP